MENLGWGLQITVLGMGAVFGLLALLWGVLTLVMRFDRPGGRAGCRALRHDRDDGTGRRRRWRARRDAATLRASGRRHGCGPDRRDRRCDAGAQRQTAAGGGPGDAQLLAGQPCSTPRAGWRAGECGRTRAGCEGDGDAALHRSTSVARTFAIDIEELAADRFNVVVDGETYEVQLSGDEDLPDAAVTPLPAPSGAAGQAPAESAAPPVRKAATPRAAASQPAARRATGGGTGTLSAPMPGVVLAIAVKPGDTVARGQEVAVLEAMKMQNSIKSPRAGTIAEVCVAAGQAVGHGDAIVRFAEG